MLRRRHARQADKARARRPAFRVERLEGRELLTFDFTIAIGIGAVSGTGSILAPYGVALDSAGDTYVAGAITGSVRLDPNSASVTASHGGRDIFVAKYSPAGVLLWSHATGSSGDDTAFSIAVDPSGNAYLTGEFTGQVNFSTNGTPLNLSASNRADVFVWKLDAGGNTSYATQTVGLTGNLDTGYAIAVDAAGNAFIGGSYQTGINPGTGLPYSVAITLGSTTLADAATFAPFAAKLNASGAFVWAKSAIGAANAINEGKAIAIDASDNVYLAGDFAGSGELQFGRQRHPHQRGQPRRVPPGVRRERIVHPGQDLRRPQQRPGRRRRRRRLEERLHLRPVFRHGELQPQRRHAGEPDDARASRASTCRSSTPAGNLAFADDLGAP